MSSPRSIVVFLGPSLARERAAMVLDAEYRPPARRGDIYALLGTGTTDVVLIDGVFHGHPSVWHRELLAALDAGIRVFGASSMGALRAAELHAYGMIGHGVVFGLYRNRVLEDDDEVALQHRDADGAYCALSKPMVNLRSTLEVAAKEGALGSDEAAEAIRYLKSLPIRAA